MTPPILLAVPNVSEGRDARAIEAIGKAFADRASDAAHEHAAARVKLLDVHSDADHHRSVFTLAGRPRALADALLEGARATVELLDVMGRDRREREGGAGDVAQHPYVGALDVVPIVYLRASARGDACAEALVVADRLGAELGLPVFIYGELSGDHAVTRATLRRGGVGALAGRMSAAPGGATRWRPDFGPPRMHATAGATLVAAREPLVAFNVHLGGDATIADARRIASVIREGGAEGLPGVRAIAVALSAGIAQVSMNVERPLELPLARIVEAVARHAPVASAELVGLAPRAALEGFPDELELAGFDPARHVIENALRCWDGAD